MEHHLEPTQIRSSGPATGAINCVYNAASGADWPAPKRRTERPISGGFGPSWGEPGSPDIAMGLGRARLVVLCGPLRRTLTPW